MSLVTRCPACATAFKVVRDQLRISDGWVRCGRCSQVFDATLDLQEAGEDGVPLAPASARSPVPRIVEDPAPEPAPASEHQPKAQDVLTPLPTTGMGLPQMSWPAADLLDLGPKPSPLPTAPDDDASAERAFVAASVRGGLGTHQPWFDEAQFTREPRPSAPTSQPARVEPTLDASLVREPELAAVPLPGPSPIDDAVNAQLQKALRRERLKALRRERAEQKERERAATGAGALTPKTEPVTPLLEAPAAAVTFADDPTPTPRPARSRLRRALLLGACLLALAAIALQIVRHERDTLLALEPELRPALQTLCAWSDCELSALRQIGSITIEGASFAREKEGEGYRLLFTLRNGARVPLAMPSIELSLLDTQERAVVRRVLSPAQFGAPTVLGAGAERSASLPLELSGNEAAALPPVAGYRVIAFYP